jgi:hypothetical protein
VKITKRRLLEVLVFFCFGAREGSEGERGGGSDDGDPPFDVAHIYIDEKGDDGRID